MARKARAGVSVSLRKPSPLLPPEPPDAMFFLSAPPRQAGSRYVVQADGIIEADKVVMA